jgi:hypothetical protein
MRTLSQADLAIIICERLAYGTFQRDNQKKRHERRKLAPRRELTARMSASLLALRCHVRWYRL